ncbi:MAG: DUF3179 domain-containing (seleno)protein [Pseudomonadota bacterium]
MISVFYSQSRFLLIMVSALVLLGWVGVPHAQEAKTKPSAYAIEQFGEPPIVPQGPLSEALQYAIKSTFIDSIEQPWGRDQWAGLHEISESSDPRVVWILADRLRFTWQQQLHGAFAKAAGRLLGKEMKSHRHWSEITNHLIAWDIPSYPGYLKDKRAIFTNFVPGWEKIFVEGDVDWRHVSWGGVLIDDRAFDTTDKECNCIPAADNPEVSSAEDATWLKDDDIVFGIGINGEYRAYPRRIMEVREMVNDTLGGRNLGIPYCTLCGAAQAYYTDRLPEGIERPVLRTSGLLIRSNKVMYDITSNSVFDTFLGTAVTGPLAEKKLKLKQASVVTTDWGTWKKEHPETTVLVEKLALGRDFDFRNNRDADGPIFPVGDVDPRLSIHEDVLGVITQSGEPVAFQRSKAFAALKSGEKIVFEDIQLKLDAGGIKAIGPDGTDLGSHEAFWFAWSQFHTDTAVWPLTSEN